jgi:hypothetical protein
VADSATVQSGSVVNINVVDNDVGGKEPYSVSELLLAGIQGTAEIAPDKAHIIYTAPAGITVDTVSLMDW